MNETEVVSTDCPPPRELTFIENAEQWIMSLPQDDADKFIYGLSMEAILVLFKYFPDNEMVKELLRSRI